MKILAKLNEIQIKLNAPKGQYNSFGKYSYRSCEDILEGIKPLLKEQNCALTVNDEIVQIGDRYYIKATATLHDCETGEIISNNAMAREEESKKGMDSAQVTGATSSYARKYALNGLLAIDDNKDPDTDEHKQQQAKPDRAKAQEPRYEEMQNEAIGDELVSKENIEALRMRMKKKGVSDLQICSRYEINAMDEMKKKVWNKAMRALEKTTDVKREDLGL